MKISIKTHGSQINFIAWGIVRKHALSWGEAFRAAIQALKIKITMEKGKTEFSFLKKDGSTRHAFGTRNLDLIPSESWPKNSSIPSVTNVVKYFDLEKNAWRSFQAVSLIAA